MNKQVTAAELTRMLDGRLEGTSLSKLEISGTCAIDSYLENHASFIKSDKYLKYLDKLKGAVVLIPEDLAESCLKYPQNGYIIVKDVAKAMMKLQEFFYADNYLLKAEGISPLAWIDDSASIGKGCYIGGNVFIGRNVTIGDGVSIWPNSVIFDDVIIGSGSYIYPGVCIYRNCQLGEDCLLHSGVCIGSDGFRFEHDMPHKKVLKMHHAGRVIIGNRVEIGANSAIDRGTFEDGATILGDDVKVDNLVHFGHNAVIGARTTIAALSCISGSTIIGEDVWIGAGVTVSNGLRIGDRAKVLINAVVVRDVAQDEMVSGFYAMPHKQWKRAYMKLKETSEEQPRGDD